MHPRVTQDLRADCAHSKEKTKKPSYPGRREKKKTLPSYPGRREEKKETAKLPEQAGTKENRAKPCELSLDLDCSR